MQSKQHICERCHEKFIGGNTARFYLDCKDILWLESQHKYNKKKSKAGDNL
jgi:hypothetical protein